MATDEFAIQIIRSLKSSFEILRRDETSLIMRLESVVVNGEQGAWLIEFGAPEREWANEWDSTASAWRGRPDLTRPSGGWIREAYIKRGGGSSLLSFSAGTDPLIRWGFSAASVAARRAT